MNLTCPKCKCVIPARQVNVAADAAVCDSCNEAFAISALVAAGQVPDDFDVHDPPGGAWFEDTGSGWRIGGTTRSPMALFLIPFMTVWSGLSLGGIYGTQIVNGEFDPGKSLFGIPFLLGTLVIGSITLMKVCGKVVVAIENDEGTVFQGVGPIGWTRRFDWASVRSVEEDFPDYHNSAGRMGMVIALVGTTRLKFGSLLASQRRDYLIQCLRRLLAERNR